MDQDGAVREYRCREINGIGSMRISLHVSLLNDGGGLKDRQRARKSVRRYCCGLFCPKSDVDKEPEVLEVTLLSDLRIGIKSYLAASK
jgi:hypothetical protein